MPSQPTNKNTNELSMVLAAQHYHIKAEPALVTCAKACRHACTYVRSVGWPSQHQPAHTTNTQPLVDYRSNLWGFYLIFVAFADFRETQINTTWHKTTHNLLNITQMHAFASDYSIHSSPEISPDLLTFNIAKLYSLHRLSVESPPTIATIFIS